MKPTINIMTSCDQGYAKYVPVQMVSAFENLSKYKVRFYFVHSRVPEDEVIKMKIVAELYHQDFFEIKIEYGICQYFTEALGKTSERWPEEAYYHLIAHQILPKYLDRIMYIDAADVIINGDFYEYYSVDFEGKLIAAFESENKKIYNWHNKSKRELENLARKGGFFNSGVFFLNLDLLRKANIDSVYLKKSVGYLIEQYGQKGDRPFFADQGMLNFLFYRNIKLLQILDYDIAINLQSSRVSVINKIPKIIHYCGRALKPWEFELDTKTGMDSQLCYMKRETGSYDQFSTSRQQIEWEQVWYSYARITPFSENILKESAVATKCYHKRILPLVKNCVTLDAENQILKESILYLQGLFHGDKHIFKYSGGGQFNNLLWERERTSSFTQFIVSIDFSLMPKQAINFPLYFPLEVGKPYRLRTRIETKKAISGMLIFLRKSWYKDQHICKITTEGEGHIVEFSQTFIPAVGGYNSICVTNENFKNRGDWFRIYDMMIEDISISKSESVTSRAATYHPGGEPLPF